MIMFYVKSELEKEMNEKAAFGSYLNFIMYFAILIFNLAIGASISMIVKHLELPQLLSLMVFLNIN